ncbi:MAG: TolC family protein [Chitinophagales bacterium]|nr:TolC family protein [Chitinophagales bacterium]MDW8418341.1 TolC family protein [Chitinophagales bacterium]
MRVSTLLVLFYILALVPPLAAQQAEVKALTLQEAVRFALQNTNTAKNARLNEELVRARNWEITATGLPTLNAEFGYAYYYRRPISPAFNMFFADTTSAQSKIFRHLAQQDPVIGQILYQNAIASKDMEFSFVLPHNINSSLTISQLLFDGRYLIGLKATRDFSKTARLQTELSDIEIKYNVTKAYYQAAAASEIVRLLNQNLQIIEKLLSDTRAVYKEGLLEELDVNRLELAEAQLKSQINLQKQLAKVALDNLKFQMGMRLNDELVLKDNLEDLRAAITLEVEPKFDINKRPEKELLETAIKLRGYDVAQRRSGHFPTLFAYLNYGWQAQANSLRQIFETTVITYPDGDTRRQNQWFDQGLVGVTLKVPIFDSGSRMASVKQAKLELQKMQNDLENFKNAAELQYRAYRSAFDAALIEEVNQQRAAELSEKIFKTNQIKYKEGVGNSFELVQSENDFATNQIKRVQSVLNLLNAKADLDKAMGIR